jgi:hypothetical protein
MEGIEQEITNKLIEKPKFETENLVEVKEKKPRTQAQKDAFEKARAKRAENLAKKKELENEKVKGEIETTETTNPISKIESSESKKPVARGRPKGSRNKKVMRDLEPPPTPDNPNYPQPVFHSPHQAQDHGLKYQGHPYHSMYQQPPQVHNYYYGHQQGITTKRTKTKKERAPTPPPSSESEEEISSSSSEEEIYEESVPELKYRFA